MYNEDITELQHTLSGIMQNYNCLKLDQKHKLTKDDFLVVVICDGYERIPESFKQFARSRHFLNEEILTNKGYMIKDRDGNLKMKNLKDIMDPDADPKNTPDNMLHIFQVTSWDFGVKEDYLKAHRINFIFGVKHRNDGKINSHKWFF